MKNLKMHSMNTGYWPILFVLAIILMCQGCEKENTSAPDIIRVRDIDPSLANEDLIGAGLGSWVIIQGNNLASTQKIYFNEYLCYFNPAYVTETDIVIQIPEETPNLGTNPDAPNTIRIVNKYGEAVFDFITFAPPAQADHISNEFALDGETIRLVGRYFFLVDSIIFAGEVPATEFESSSDGTFCTVLIPEGAQPGPLRIVTAGGVGGTTAGANFRITDGMICDFDEKNTWEQWGGQIVNPTSDATIPVLTGNAFMGTGTNITTGTYWVQEMAMPIVSGPYPGYDTISSADNVFVKFELFVVGVWNSGEYAVRLVRRDENFDWVETYSYLLKPWYIDESTQIDFVSESWLTFKIPLSEFKNDAGEFVQSFSDIRNFEYFGFYFQNTGLYPGEKLISSLQICVDNIRMVGWNP